VYGASINQPPNGISIVSPIFAQLGCVHNTRTDTQTTLRVTSVAIGRVCAMQAMRPNNIAKNDAGG